MKFGNISIERGNVVTGKTRLPSKRVVNIGDQAQLIAIDNLYEYMGISKEDIIDIEYYDLQTYSGEYVILPINFILFNSAYGQRILNFSDKIIPVFLGVHCIGKNFSEEEINWLKKYQPIGCRDQVTMNNLRAIGLEAYLQGCLTISLPKRSRANLKEHKVYFVDVPKSLESYIPKDIADKAVYMSQQFYGEIGENNFFECSSMKDYMKKRLQEYSENAELVVTSRLHCAAPCIAMGIPTIIVGESFSSSFSWIEKIVTLYTEKEFNKINWNPNPIECEEIKKKIMDLASNRIMKVYKKNKELLSISEFWENKETMIYDTVYIKRIRSFMNKFWDKKSFIGYIVWGVTQISDVICDYLEEEYENIKLVAVVDDYRDLNFRGLKSIKSSELKKYRNAIIVATGNSSSIAARNFCKENGYLEKQYCTIFTSDYDDYK